MRSSETLLPRTSRLLSACAALLWLLAVAGYAPAQDAKPKGDAPPSKEQAKGEGEKQGEAKPDKPEKPDDEADDAPRRFRPGGFDRRNAKDHVTVREAFRDVVRQAVQSTVAVISHGKQLALGAIVDSDGYLITKASELGEGELSCRLASGRTVEAHLIGVHKPTDLAMLKIEGEHFVPIVWREDDAPGVGSWLATTGIGAVPEAVGVVSVEARKIEQPGGMLGVVLADGDEGALVDQVLPDSGAEKAGVHVNDEITAVNGKPMPSVQVLIRTLRQMKAGQEVQLAVRRGDKRIEIEATLTSSTSFQDGLGSDLSERRGGFAAAIQHDTVLDANQCGGPVVDLDGKAVGVNIARAGRVVSFFLPAAAVLPAIAEMRGRAPAASSNPRMAALDKQLDKVRKSERDLIGQKAQLRDVLARAVTALTEARKNADKAAALKQAEAKAAEAEQAFKSVDARLTAARAEIVRLIEEKTSLAGRSGDE